MYTEVVMLVHNTNSLLVHIVTTTCCLSLYTTKKKNVSYIYMQEKRIEEKVKKRN